MIDEDTYEVEPELRIAVKQYAEFYLKRYHIDDSGHWTYKEERNNYIGQMGQTTFFILLQQLYVPNDANFPIIDWRGKKDYDYHIPNLGTVEVKTLEVGHRKLQIKKSEWHGSNYVVAFQFADRLPKRLTFRGWLTKEQVENLHYYKEAETDYNPYAACWMTDLTKLNRQKEFLEMLVERSLYPEKAKAELQRLLKTP